MAFIDLIDTYTMQILFILQHWKALPNDSKMF